MKHLVEFALENNDFILVEVEGFYAQDSDQELVSRSDRVIERAKHSFADALDTIKPVASTIVEKIRSLNDPPDEMEVKFGVKMNAAAGAVIASAGVDANYEITLKWKKS